MLPQTCLWHDSALWPPESSAPIWALLRYQETRPSFKTDTKWLLLNLGQLRPVTSSQVLPSPVTDQQRPPLAPHRLVLYKPHSLPLSPIPPRFSWVSCLYSKLLHLLTFLRTSSGAIHPHRLSETSLVQDKSRTTDAQAPGPWLAGPWILQTFAHLDFPFSRRQLGEKAGHRLPSAGHWRYWPHFRSTRVASAGWNEERAFIEFLLYFRTELDAGV